MCLDKTWGDKLMLIAVGYIWKKSSIKKNLHFTKTIMWKSVTDEKKK